MLEVGVFMSLCTFLCLSNVMTGTSIFKPFFQNSKIKLPIKFQIRKDLTSN
ncbi:hypothetical protein THOA03_80009 [Vibrio owensii]|nr:hypothetical protein THOA03_80009 [Vibrio owensii]